MNIEAYSTPITPAPTTTIVSGISSMWRIPSESRTVRSLNATPSGWVGREPGARTNRSAPMRRSPSSETTFSSLGPAKEAMPSTTVTWLRMSWSRTTLRSVSMTCSMRDRRSPKVRSAFTRKAWP